MKKNIIIAMALALGTLSVGALSASASDYCAKCVDNQVFQKFSQEAGSLTGDIKAKDQELRELNANDTIDTRKVSAVESELKELKKRYNLLADKHGIADCCRS